MSSSLSPGTKLGRYEIRSKIGEGGMGEVYLARDAKLDRNLALKILPAEVASKRDRMERFIREAKSAAALNHPNIAHVYEIDEVEGQHFIAMEFIDGHTLRELIHDRQTELRRLLRYLQHVAKEKYVSPYDLAILYTGLGEKDQALEQLNKALDERAAWIMNLKVEPLFDPLHSEPRFADLVRRLGLPQ